MLTSAQSKALADAVSKGPGAYPITKQRMGAATVWMLTIASVGSRGYKTKAEATAAYEMQLEQWVVQQSSANEMSRTTDTRTLTASLRLVDILRPRSPDRLQWCQIVT